MHSENIDKLPELVDFDTLVAIVLPVSRPTLWRWEQAGKFPKRIRIGGRNFWRRAELLEWHKNQGAQ